jgi:hypothetical protein
LLVCVVSAIRNSCRGLKAFDLLVLGMLAWIWLPGPAALDYAPLNVTDDSEVGIVLSHVVLQSDASDAVANGTAVRAAVVDATPYEEKTGLGAHDKADQELEQQQEQQHSHEQHQQRECDWDQEWNAASVSSCGRTGLSSCLFSPPLLPLIFVLLVALQAKFESDVSDAATFADQVMTKAGLCGLSDGFLDGVELDAVGVRGGVDERLQEVGVGESW